MDKPWFNLMSEKNYDPVNSSTSVSFIRIITTWKGSILFPLFQYHILKSSHYISSSVSLIQSRHDSHSSPRDNYNTLSIWNEISKIINSNHHDTDPRHNCVSSKILSPFSSDWVRRLLIVANMLVGITTLQSKVSPSKWLSVIK